MAFASSAIPSPPPPPISMPVWSMATPLSLPMASGKSTILSKEKDEVVDTKISETCASFENGYNNLEDNDDEEVLESTSMNIVTFATPVSVAPPKLWAVSLYSNTLTRDAFLRSKVAVLQLLCPSHKHLVPILGKRSGYEQNYSKRNECAKMTMKWLKHGGVAEDDADAFISHEDRIGALKSLDLLPECASYIQVELTGVTNAGDHDIAICEVVRTGVWDTMQSKVVAVVPDNEKEAMSPKDHTTVLYTGQLREEGII
uniref:Flavin reductase like domain-containing protein n=1 Tax=Ditylum brightwellii TaxID=49249 RepID=A0A7S4WDD1_9STRA